MKLILQTMETYTGTALEIVKQMMGSAMFTDHKTLREYMELVMKNAKVHHDLELVIHGKTNEDQARSLIFQVVEHKLGILIDDNREDGPK